MAAHALRVVRGFAGATAHGLLSGSDSGRLWALAIYAVSVALIVSLTTWRIDSTAAARRAKAAPATPEPLQRSRARAESFTEGVERAAGAHVSDVERVGPRPGRRGPPQTGLRPVQWRAASPTLRAYPP